MALSTAAIIGLVVAGTAATATAVTVSSSRKAQKSARSIAADQQRAAQDQQDALTTALTEGAPSSTKTTKAVTASRDRARQRAAAATGRADTILTNPRGAIGAAPVKRKKLVGS